MKGKPPQLSDPKKPRGFIYVDRKLKTDWKWDARYRGAWLWLMIEAAFKDHDGLKSGQVRFSVKKSMELWGIKESMARRFLRRCENDGDIIWKRGHGGKSPIVSREQNRDSQSDAIHDAQYDAHWGIITLVNYDKYQSRQPAADAHCGAQSDAESGADIPIEERRIKKEKRTASPSAQRSDHNIFVQHFYRRYGEIFSDPETREPIKPVITEKDGANLKRVLGTLTLGDLKKRLERFFQDTRPFVVEGGHTLALFCSQINAYAVRAKAEPLKPRNAGPQYEDLTHYQP